MREDILVNLLEEVRNGTLDTKEALQKLRHLPFDDLGFVKIDNHREIRTGFPEVIFCPGKTSEQILAIVKRMNESGSNILASRMKKETADFMLGHFPLAEYFETAGIFYIENKTPVMNNKTVLVVSAGTSDIPVAEEAAVTAEKTGNKVERVYDAGVAGIHRLLSARDKLLSAGVVIAVAGMEGALASVVGGLTDKPVIAVPTSVGYGASFGGIAALLAMLNSCASGVTVVNIDNGFGAGYAAALINRQIKD
ncbi:MAG TPA: nickel pincer cofactor biosynthesis protein LarB [Spirochaetota bacterium]|nr:nickel pincer cofactor biosynthesis protein LarB [Spirochaetota bacterium]HOR44839.1 nickel pincer cofactor biosynthesis protein LarB [Spirochaetota bacterium]HPK56148.1 nickel pincer cofactor biosynthesis protein LarB [Spirochaetota bacterium]